MRSSFAFLLLAGLVTMAMGACTPAERPAAAPEASVAETAATATPEIIGGWRIDRAAYSTIGDPIAAFRTSLHGGGEIGSEEMRGRWTILAFWGLWSEDSLADLPYLSAMSSAADQDPELDFLAIHTPPLSGDRETMLGGYLSLEQGLKERGGGWRTAIDETGSISTSFGLADLPIYLLVGPDLSIRAVHGELHGSAEDGIKPMFRGVAEIRRRTAAAPR